MRDPRKQWLRRSGRVGVLAALVFVAAAAGMLAFRPWARAHADLDKLPRTAAKRADVQLELCTSGQVESAKQTLIECELENLQFRSQGHSLSVGGSSTVLWIIPDGTIVKKGDVLCELDATDYDELVRQQEIKVEEARSAKVMAELDLQVAELAVHEYSDGVRKQDEQTLKSNIALADSDAQRQRDRLAWTTLMRNKGYASAGQFATEKANLQRAELLLMEARTALDQYQRFTVRSTLMGLNNDVEAARANLRYQTMRLTRHTERLKHYREQVDLCTIKAPHDGFVIYANDRNRNIQIEEGMQVHQRQDLFYLPDLANMEVRALLHETVVDHVRDGMPAKVRVEALPGVIMDGHVTSVAPLPVMTRGSIGSDIKNYEGVVKLDAVPNGLRPGMTAEVKILTGTHLDAIVVPPEAVSIEHGHDVCYIAAADHLERREVTVGAVTSEFLEVTGGLSEGEQVVLDPTAHGLAVSPSSEARLDAFATADAE